LGRSRIVSPLPPIIASALTPNGVNIEKELFGLPSQPPLQQVGGEESKSIAPLLLPSSVFLLEGRLGGEESWI